MNEHSPNKKKRKIDEEDEDNVARKALKGGEGISTGLTQEFASVVGGEKSRSWSDRDEKLAALEKELAYAKSKFHYYSDLVQKALAEEAEHAAKKQEYEKQQSIWIDKKKRLEQNIRGKPLKATWSRKINDNNRVETRNCCCFGNRYVFTTRLTTIDVY
jgi:hypothetical protein